MKKATWINLKNGLIRGTAKFFEGVLLLVVATFLVYLLLDWGNFGEKTFAEKYIDISGYFMRGFGRNFLFSYGICFIYAFAYWVYKYINYKLPFHRTVKKPGWHVKQFLGNLLIPSLMVGIMLTLREDDFTKFLFPVTLLVAINNIKLLFMTSAISKKVNGEDLLEAKVAKERKKFQKISARKYKKFHGDRRWIRHK